MHLLWYLHVKNLTGGIYLSMGTVDSELIFKTISVNSDEMNTEVQKYFLNRVLGSLG